MNFSTVFQQVFPFASERRFKAPVAEAAISNVMGLAPSYASDLSLWKELYIFFLVISGMNENQVRGLTRSRFDARLEEEQLDWTYKQASQIDVVVEACVALIGVLGDRTDQIARLARQTIEVINGERCPYSKARIGAVPEIEEASPIAELEKSSFRATVMASAYRTVGQIANLIAQ